VISVDFLIVSRCVRRLDTIFKFLENNMQRMAYSKTITLVVFAFACVVRGFLVPKIRILHHRSHECFTAMRSEKIERDANAPKPSVAPYFKIKDWDAALPIMQEFDDLAAMLEVPAFGWSMSNDNMVFRATLNDENELANFYVDSLASLIDRMLEKAAAIDRVEIAGLSEGTPKGVESRPYSTKRYKLEDVSGLCSYFLQINDSHRHMEQLRRVSFQS